MNNTPRCIHALYAVDAVSGWWPPDVLAFTGEVLIDDKPDDFFPNKAFVSNVINNPTYINLKKNVINKWISTYIFWKNTDTKESNPQFNTNKISYL